MTTISLRTDAETDAALAYLTRMTNKDRSSVIRSSILAAERELVLARVEEQSRMVAADPDDLAEAQAILADMGALRAW